MIFGLTDEQGGKMKKKRRNVLVYTDDTVKWYTQLTVQVDENGSEWLTPGQVDFLEFAHLWARYEGSNQLEALRPLVGYWELPMPQVGASVATHSIAEFARSTPAFNGVLI